MMKMVREEKDKVLIHCAFCNGLGKDPFGIMSRLSTCYACMGEKSVWVAKPIKECVYCAGTGVSPIGARDYCIVCQGRGVVSLEEPWETCPACGGRGSHSLVGLYCISCKGKGAIPIEEEVWGYAYEDFCADRSGRKLKPSQKLPISPGAKREPDSGT